MFAVVCLLAVICTTPSFSAGSINSAKEGFRGVKWGDDISKHPNFVLVERDGKSSYYTRPDENLEIGGGKLSLVAYAFFEGKFGAAYVSFPGGGVNFDKIKAAVFEKYGVGSQPNRYIEKYFWNGNEWGISLSGNEYGEGSFYLLTHKYLSDWENEEKEKARQGAKKDF